MKTTQNSQRKEALQLMQQVLHELAVLEQMFDNSMARLESKLAQAVAA